jgi:hypothetical protein
MRSVRIIAGVLVALGLSATAAQAKLEGEFRTGFVRSAQASCLKKQRAAAVNAQLSDSLLVAYCTCTADYVAENADANQMVLSGGDISRGIMPAWLADMGKQATRYCVANIKDYVKSN